VLFYKPPISQAGGFVGKVTSVPCVWRGGGGRVLLQETRLCLAGRAPHIPALRSPHANEALKPDGEELIAVLRPLDTVAARGGSGKRGPHPQHVPGPQGSGGCG